MVAGSNSNAPANLRGGFSSKISHARRFRMNDVGFGKFSEGWAVGDDGQILHNQDGGPIWTAQRTSTGRNLIDLDMKFAPLGWAVA